MSLWNYYKDEANYSANKIYDNDNKISKQQQQINPLIRRQK